MDIFYAAIEWNPNRNLFTVPYIKHPITWYGVLFAFGFLLGYFIIRHLFYRYLLNHPPKITKKNPSTLTAGLQSVQMADRLTLLAIIGTIIGARLGHVFFYDWPEYRANPVNIFKIWEGGLASHGAALGILLALWVFTLWQRRSVKFLTFLTVLDALVIPTALIGCFIRIGNFINQEILGTPTALPWGVIFLNPVDRVSLVPRHPVQVYESFFYLLTFCFLLLVWIRRHKELGSGLLSGVFFLMIFGFRFLIEFIKIPQSHVIDETKFLNMGQILSIPFILLGIALIIYSLNHKTAKR